MKIINEANYGEKTYIISLATGLAWVEQYQVAAYDVIGAIDIVADYLEAHECTNLYYDYLELKCIAECSEWKTCEAFAEAHNLICCGNHGIYIELANVEEVTK